MENQTTYNVVCKGSIEIEESISISIANLQIGKSNTFLGIRRESPSYYLLAFGL